jgi:signal transduction histidine kinase/CheY-like chemotaxis protein
MKKNIISLVEKSQNDLYKTIDSTPSCIKVLNSKGELLYMNNQGIDLIEADNEESVLGGDVYSLVEESHRDKFIQFNEKVCSGIKGTLTFEIIGLKGGRRWMETYASPFLLESGETAHIAITNDISEKIEREKEIELQSKLIHAMGEIKSKFLQGVNEKEIFDSLLAQVLEMTESKYGYIGEVLYKEEQPYLKTKSITDISWNEEIKEIYFENAPQGMEFTNLNSLFGHVLKHNEHVISNSPKNDPRKAGITLGHPLLDSYLGIALRFDNQLIGSVGLGNKEGGYTEEDIEFLTPYLDTCSLLIKAIRDRKGLERAKEKAVSASMAKSSFLSNMSHEMRTPLNAILGTTQLLKGENLNDKIKEDFDVIESSSNSLLSLVNNILDLSKIESGMLELKRANFSSKEIFREIEKIFKPMTNSKGIEFLITEETAIPDYLFGDKIRINQILINLIGNAVKFTEKGRIEILFNYSSGVLKTTVSDTGIGIDEESVDYVFNMFTQIENHHSHLVLGTGLGLAISKDLAKAMDGDLNVKRKVDVGTDFILEIPCAEASNVEQIDELDFSKLLFDEHLKILVVEDNSVNSMVLTRMLSKLNLKADLATDGLQAVELAKKNSYDFIFMDIMMPVMDGIEATEQIRRLGLKKKPFVLACTANVTKTDQKKCLDAGMDDFITKPIDFNHLGKTLNQFIKSNPKK